jgi:hypothetical protein
MLARANSNLAAAVRHSKNASVKRMYVEYVRLQLHSFIRFTGIVLKPYARQMLFYIIHIFLYFCPDAPKSTVKCSDKSHFVTKIV